MKNKKKTKLAKYLEEMCIMQAGFAKKIGISPPSLIPLLRGERTPSLELAFKIEKATQGAVKATDWIEEKDEE